METPTLPSAESPVIQNRSEAILAYITGEPEFTLFYQTNYPKIGPGVFSQWWPAEFSGLDGTPFCSTEQYMMAHKATIFRDQEAFAKIMDTKDPGKIKKLGRAVKNFDKKIWYQESRASVLRANWLKFIQNEELKDYLLSTGDSIIVECSPSDTIWGVGLPLSNPKCLDPVMWNGLNWLGFCIMAARHCIRYKMAPDVASVSLAREFYS